MQVQEGFDLLCFNVVHSSGGACIDYMHEI